MNNLINRIQEVGGTAMLIGGAVIDSILGLEIKDWDIEVYGLSMFQLEEVLVSLGLPVNTVGKSFGIINNLNKKNEKNN